MRPNQRCGGFGWNASARMLLLGCAGLFGLALGWVSSARPAGLPALPTLSVDPNSVPEPVLGALPGMGPVLSRRVVAEREIRPFDSLGDLDRRVKGIGPAKVAALRPFLRFDPPSSIHP